MVKILDTDDPKQIAYKIFNGFEVNDSCRIHGFHIGAKGVSMKPKGEVVLYELELLDADENCRYTTNKNGESKKIRNYKYKFNSIGGTIAQKIFSYEKRIVDNEPRYLIWRFQ